MIRIREIDFSEVVKTNPTLYDNVKLMLELHRFEFSTPTRMKELCGLLSALIGRDIIDKTTNQMIYSQQYCLVVNCAGKEYPLLEYAKNSILLERKDKLLKIKSKL